MDDAFARLESRWAAAHAKSLTGVRALAASEPPSPATAANRLPPGTLDSATLARVLALERAEHGMAAQYLDDHLDELESVLDDMHALAGEAREAAAALPLADAADRGAHGLRLSPADRASLLAAPLRAYEAELDMKRHITAALRARPPPPPAQVASLLVAWESKPLLQPVDDLRRGAEAQAAFEPRRAAVT